MGSICFGERRSISLVFPIGTEILHDVIHHNSKPFWLNSDWYEAGTGLFTDLLDAQNLNVKKYKNYYCFQSFLYLCGKIFNSIMISQLINF